jgi:TRAP-type C4-dicarboxylate transport system permease small subunit
VTTASGVWPKRVERLFEIITSALLVILALEVLLGIAFRAARRPLAWYDEVASVLLAWLTYYGSALAALKNAHIGFPGLVNSLGRGGRFAVLAFREIVVIGFFLILAWEGTRILGALAGDTLVTVDIPVTFTQSAIPIGAALFVLAELLKLPERIEWARGTRPPAAAQPEAAKELSH